MKGVDSLIVGGSVAQFREKGTRAVSATRSVLSSHVRTSRNDHALRGSRAFRPNLICAENTFALQTMG